MSGFEDMSPKQEAAVAALLAHPTVAVLSD